MTILVFAGLLMAAATLAKFWLEAQPDMVREEITSAMVLSVTDKEVEYRGTHGNKNAISIAFAELQLTDGKTFTASVPKPYPSPGDKVSVKVVEYSDGTRSASFFR